MKTVTLLSGQNMPIIGLGTWQAKSEIVEQAVTWALETGYRLIDTAYSYGNEQAIGQAIQKWILQGGKRDELFITTKLPSFGNRASNVSKYLDKSLKHLCLDYVDLYLVHHPFGFLEPAKGMETPLLDQSTDHVTIWKELEAAVNAGFVKNIGLSNFNKKQIEKILSFAQIPPANLQIELHAFLQQLDLINWCKQKEITVTAYAPLGSPAAKTHFKNKYNFQLNHTLDCLSEPKVLDIAERLQKSPAQILLKFLIQMDIAVVPKSTSKERIKENFEKFPDFSVSGIMILTSNHKGTKLLRLKEFVGSPILLHLHNTTRFIALNFDLGEEDMKILKSLDRGEQGRIFDFLFYKGVEAHPEYPFPIKVLT